MKAFKVHYTKPGETTSAIVLAETEEEIHEALCEKDFEYKRGGPWSKITIKREIPLSNVMARDLSVAELLRLFKS